MKRSILIQIFLILFAFECAFAQTVENANTELDRNLDSIASAAIDREKIPGMSVAIGLNNQLIYSRAFGFADLENRVRATTETRFRTASIAKPITAVGVLRLYEQGKIDLDSAVQEYVPDFPEKMWEVTMRNLLSHTSGMRHYNKPGESTGKSHFLTIEDSLELFSNDPLLHKPGSRKTYSTFGYSVLGNAIENVSGLSFDEYLEEEIFKPAGMKSTCVDNSRLIIPDRSRGYMRMTQSIQRKIPATLRHKYPIGETFNATLHDTSMKVPGGGLLSTSEDLVRFVIAFNELRLLGERTRQAMLTRQTLSNGEKIDYGLGWKLEQDAGGPRLISHSGSQAGTSTFLVSIPEHGLVVAVMCNLEGVSAKTIARELGMAVIKNK